VRTGLKADVFLSTNCETFNHLFIDTLKYYKGISNYIAPVNSPYIGDTMIFSMMFYNLLLKKTRPTSKTISDSVVIDSFFKAKESYKKYNAIDDFRLYNWKYEKHFK
jgi:hypothetical protein